MKTKILVTGGTGYIASWIIKYLLEDGYTVHTTVRNKSNEEKYRHLKEIEDKSKGELKIFEADLLDEGSFKEAMEGVDRVIHTASPFFISGIKDAQKQLIEPAKMGTKNVLETANEIETVKKVVVTSSAAAIYGDNADVYDAPDNTFTEKIWNTSSNLKHQPYSYSKTVAEKQAWEIAEKQHRWILTTINPGFVIGPSLTKRTDSTSIDFVKSIVDGRFKMGVPDLYIGVVDVRDVARAHINAALLEKATSRHILVAETLNALDLAGFVKEKYGEHYPVPKKHLPKFLLYLFGPFMGFSWKYIRLNMGIPMKFDNSFSKENLDIDYRDPKDSILDHINQLIRDRLVKK